MAAAALCHFRIFASNLSLHSVNLRVNLVALSETTNIMINSRLNKMYIAFTASIMSDFCGNNGRYGDNGIPFSTLSPHSTKFHASFRASIFCVFSEMRTNVIRKVAHMLSFFITCQKGRKPVCFPSRV